MAEEYGTVGAMSIQCVMDSERWFPSVAHSVEHNALAMAGEVGEFANIVKKIQRGSLDPREPVVKHDMAMELTDIFIYVLNLAGLLGVDLEKSYKLKRAENEKRFNHG